MPTFNQLVRKGRQTAAKKSNSPALQKSVNSLRKTTVEQSSPQKRGVCTALEQLHLRSLTQHLERLPEYVFLTVSRLQATSQAKDTTFRSIVLFLSVEEE